jgi:hypothetical protein
MTLDDSMVSALSSISYIPEDTVLGVFCNGNDFPLLVND